MIVEHDEEISQSVVTGIKMSVMWATLIRPMTILYTANDARHVHAITTSNLQKKVKWPFAVIIKLTAPFREPCVCSH